ncbi:hypothetical protein [Streptomyces sp. NPDC051569]|uniref:hypothetical protein n=1 Tax=Streptomyces sp. NPDC051569 TaxID=3365661 RepID=UPI0037ADC61E
MSIFDLLTDVAKTGRMGPVFSGARWDDVTAALGEPMNMALLSGSRDGPELLAYGDLEVSACHCRSVVEAICVQTWRDVIELPGRPAEPGPLAYDQVAAALDAAACDWEPYPPLTFGTQLTLVTTATGTTFTFEAFDGAPPVLNVVGLLVTPHGCAENPAAT